MKIGIIVATNEELAETEKLMSNIEKKQIYDLIFFTGKIHEKDVILVKCGVGKVNAARTAQTMIDKFEVNKVINIGAAGGINPNLNILDIVIGEKLVQYDFDITADSKYKKGELIGIGRFIESDKELISLCEKVVENKNNRNYKIVVGTIATADLFCTDAQLAKDIRKEFGAECVEMEGAAIAQVCFLDNIPFLVIRGISDCPNNNNAIDYNTFCQIAAKQAAEMLESIIKVIDY